MNLKILSFDGALNYQPKDKTYVVRIGNSFDILDLYPLKESKNWVKINNYYFDDLWPVSWKEYSWVDVNGENFEKYFSSQKKNYPKTTKESLMGYLESRGHPYGRHTLFSEEIAKRILDDFEEVKKNVDTALVHCVRGKNRSPAIGMAINEIYGWGIENLKEKFPSYRRFVYNLMLEAGKSLYTKNSSDS